MREDEERARRLLVGALLGAAADINAGGDIEGAFRALGDVVRSWKARGTAAAAPSGSAMAPSGPGAALALVPKPAAESGPESAAKLAERETVRKIFQHWQYTCDHPKAKATPERVAKIRQRLRDGYTEADIIAAINGCAASPFHRGENENATRYDDLTLILRNGSTLEKFRDKAPAGSVDDYAASVREKTPQEIERDREIASMEREAKAALKAGKVEKYNDLVRSIRERRGDSSRGA